MQFLAFFVLSQSCPHHPNLQLSRHPAECPAPISCDCPRPRQPWLTTSLTVSPGWPAPGVSCQGTRRGVSGWLRPFFIRWPRSVHDVAGVSLYHEVVHCVDVTETWRRPPAAAVPVPVWVLLRPGCEPGLGCGAHVTLVSFCGTCRLFSQVADAVRLHRQ